MGWKQDELAERSGVTRPVIQEFEGGNRVPITNNLRAIRAALETGGVIFEMSEPGRTGISFTDTDALE